MADETLTVIDFKYGVGILVEAEKNPQMMCYALGALQLFDSIYDIDSVTMTIFQPRRDSVSTYTISKEELLKWADEVLAPTAQLAPKAKANTKPETIASSARLKPSAAREPNTTWNLHVMILKCLPHLKMMRLRPF